MGLPTDSTQSEILHILVYLDRFLRELKNSAEDPVAPFKISDHQDAICCAQESFEQGSCNKGKLCSFSKSSEKGKEDSRFPVG